MFKKNPFCFLLTELQMTTIVVKHPSLPNNRLSDLPEWIEPSS